MLSPMIVTTGCYERVVGNDAGAGKSMRKEYAKRVCEKSMRMAIEVMRNQFGKAQSGKAHNRHPTVSGSTREWRQRGRL